MCHVLHQVCIDEGCCHCRKGTSFDLAPLAGLNPIGLEIKAFTPQQLATFRFARVKAELEQVGEGKALTQHASDAGLEAAPAHSVQGLCMFQGQDYKWQVADVQRLLQPWLSEPTGGALEPCCSKQSHGACKLP